MTSPQRNPKQAATFPVRLAIAAVGLLCVGLLGASPASAAFEQVGCFAGSLPGLVDSCKPVSEEKFGEEVQLGGVGGMAVNYTGAGGVPVGTVYAATKVPGEPVRVAMFVPKVGDLEFSLGWEVTNFEAPSYERCGPALSTECPTRVKASSGFADVDVDQTTGNVFVSDGGLNVPSKKYIIVYTPDGSEELTRFGERIAEGSTSESPDKLHSFPPPGAVSVNSAGEVYIFDVNAFDNFYHRLMKFVPKVPGKFDEYEYAGAAEDVGAGFGAAGQPAKPVLDSAGNVYVSSQETSVEMYDTANPGDLPVCSFNFAKGGISGLTVNPLSGEVFFFSYKLPKRLYRLGPCNAATGKFEGKAGEVIVDEFEVAPQRDDLWGLAFDPLRKFSPSRPAGVLYAGAPSPAPNSGVGKGEPGQSSLGYIFAPAEENPPVVEEESFSHITATSAELEALIDPKGFKTRYAFQYITEAAYQEGGESFEGAMEAPLGGGFLAGTGAPESVGATLTGLSPDTAYRYRAVAESHCDPGEPEKACEDAGEAQSFRTFPLEEPGLADGRAYELVSPPNKNSGQVLPADSSIRSCFPRDCKPGDTYVHFPMLSTADGEAVVYEGTSFGNGEGASIENQYIARRTATGWQSVNLTPPLLPKGAQGYVAFDEALSEGVLGQPRPALSPEAPPNYENLYAQPTTDPLALRPLVVAQPPNRPGFGSGEFKLTYAGASADLSRVFFEANDALTEETPFAPAALDGGSAKFNLYEWERGTGELRLVNVLPGNAETAAGAAFGVASANAISADGSRAFWSDEAGQVYVREDAEATQEIPDPGKFLSAATDGSRVLLDNGHIYDLEEETTADLTEGKGGFQGIAGQSEDLSRVYFVDTEVLTGEEENSEGDKAEAGKFNLYAWEEEGGARYVATLLASDNSGGAGLISPTHSWFRFPFARTAQASPAGRYLTFLSLAPLTGYDNTGPCAVIGETGEFVDVPCPQVFLYDSATGELSCPSCNSTGTPPLGHSALRRIKSSTAAPSPLPQPRYLTDSGRLYFDSQDSLTLSDTNEGVEDVYQYEPQGVGNCEREDGCVSLISAGTGTVDSNLLAVDQTGKSAFFTSRDRLVAKDKDELIDLYVAREEGGIAAETETLRPECQGEACQPAAFAPNDPTPGSSSFKGPGNAKEGKAKPRCPKGRRQVRRKGKARCVKRNRNRARTAGRNRGGVK